MTVKGIIFDFDGTLAELNIDFQLMRRLVESSARQMGFQETWPGGYLLEQVERVSRSLGNGFSKKAGKIIQEVEIEAARRGRLFFFSRDLLARARYLGLGLGIVSRNCGPAIRVVFPDIEEHADIFLPREAVAKPKPDPEHIQLAAQSLGLMTEETVMVGDHPMDVLTGRAAGCHTVGVTSGRMSAAELEEAGADMVLPDASSLLEYLREIR